MSLQVIGNIETDDVDESDYSDSDVEIVSDKEYLSHSANETNNFSNTGNTAGNLGNDDDEDEELEIFGSNATKPNVKKSTAKKLNIFENKSIKEEPNSLLSAITVAISNVENGSNEISSINNPIPVNNKSENDDVFGIAYKPFKKTNIDYSTPTANHFDDDFDHKSQSLLNNNNNTVHDSEFDFDDHGTDNVPVNEAIDLALLRAKDKGDIIIETTDEPIDSSNLTKIESETTESISIRESSKIAFNELTNIYSSGLGDIEVRTLDKESATTSNSKIVNNKLILQPMKNLQEDIIEEGDEDLEFEEELRQAEEMLIIKTEELELENEWSKLDNTLVIETNNCFNHITTYAETIEYFESIDLSQYKSLIVTHEEQKSWSLISSAIPLKFENCIEKLEFPFLLAQVDYDSNNENHFNILQSIYEVLINKPDLSSNKPLKGCQVIGNHWERIGFQGIDPCTDLNRSMKMFAVLQVHYLVNQDYLFARDLHELSQSANTSLKDFRPKKGEIDPSWPFMCVSVMFTREILQALRRGDLNKKCNQRKDVLSVCHDYYRACFYEFARLLISKPNIHHAEHLKVVRDVCASNSTQLYRNYRNMIKKYQTTCDISTESVLALLSYKPKEVKTNFVKSVKNIESNDNEIPVSFDNIDDISENNEKSNETIWSSIGIKSRASKFKI